METVSIVAVSILGATMSIFFWFREGVIATEARSRISAEGYNSMAEVPSEVFQRVLKEVSTEVPLLPFLARR